MNNIELRSEIIDKINLVNDNEILSTVYKILDSNYLENDIFPLSNSHKMAIEEAMIQIGNSEFYTNEQANEEINEWLRK
jgi:hypothetical protein